MSIKTTLQHSKANIGSWPRLSSETISKCDYPFEYGVKLELSDYFSWFAPKETINEICSYVGAVMEDMNRKASAVNYSDSELRKVISDEYNRGQLSGFEVERINTSVHLSSYFFLKVPVCSICDKLLKKYKRD